MDVEGNRVHICNHVLYSVDRGIYEDTPKTFTSDKFITPPAETIQLLRQYRARQNGERLRPGEYYQYQGFVFAQDTGKSMHPDSVTEWLKKFSKRLCYAQVSTTANIYAHVMAEADQKNADILGTCS